MIRKGWDYFLSGFQGTFKDSLTNAIENYRYEQRLNDQRRYSEQQRDEQRSYDTTLKDKERERVNTMFANTLGLVNNVTNETNKPTEFVNKPYERFSFDNSQPNALMPNTPTQDLQTLFNIDQVIKEPTEADYYKYAQANIKTPEQWDLYTALVKQKMDTRKTETMVYDKGRAYYQDPITKALTSAPESMDIQDQYPYYDERMGNGNVMRYRIGRDDKLIPVREIIQYNTTTGTTNTSSYRSNDTGTNNNTNKTGSGDLNIYQDLADRRQNVDSALELSDLTGQATDTKIIEDNKVANIVLTKMQPLGNDNSIMYIDKNDTSYTVANIYNSINSARNLDVLNGIYNDTLQKLKNSVAKENLIMVYHARVIKLTSSEYTSEKNKKGTTTDAEPIEEGN